MTSKRTAGGWRGHGRVMRLVGVLCSVGAVAALVSVSLVLPSHARAVVCAPLTGSAPLAAGVGEDSPVSGGKLYLSGASVSSLLAFDPGSGSITPVSGYFGSLRAGAVFNPATNQAVAVENPAAGWEIRTIDTTTDTIVAGRPIGTTASIRNLGNLVLDSATNSAFFTAERIQPSGAYLLYVYDIGANFLSSVNLTLRYPGPGSGRPLGLSIDGTLNQLYLSLSGRVEVLDATTLAAIVTIPGAPLPAAVDETTHRGYALTGGGLAVWDLTTNVVTPPATTDPDLVEGSFAPPISRVDACGSTHPRSSSRWIPRPERSCPRLALMGVWEPGIRPMAASTRGAPTSRPRRAGCSGTPMR